MFFSGKDASCIRQLTALKWHPTIPNVITVLDSLSSKLYLFDIIVAQKQHLSLESIERPAYYIDLQVVRALHD